MEDNKLVLDRKLQWMSDHQNISAVSCLDYLEGNDPDTFELEVINLNDNIWCYQPVNDMVSEDGHCLDVMYLLPGEEMPNNKDKNVGYVFVITYETAAKISIAGNFDRFDGNVTMSIGVKTFRYYFIDDNQIVISAISGFLAPVERFNVSGSESTLLDKMTNVVKKHTIRYCEHYLMHDIF